MIALKSVDEMHWYLQGELTVDTIDSVLKEGRRMFSKLKSGSDVHLDCSQLEKVDSASVALLIEWVRAARKKKIHLTFEKIPDKMQRIIELSNLTALLSEPQA